MSHEVDCGVILKMIAWSVFQIVRISKITRVWLPSRHFQHQKSCEKCKNILTFNVRISNRRQHFNCFYLALKKRQKSFEKLIRHWIDVVKSTLPSGFTAHYGRWTHMHMEDAFLILQKAQSCSRCAKANTKWPFVM